MHTEPTLDRSRTYKILVKTLSLLIGIGIWYLLSEHHEDKVKLSIPVYFYNSDSYKKLSAPEKITIDVAGTRCRLRTINFNTLAVHIDARSLQNGPNKITVTTDSLHLPKAIRLIEHSPLNILVDNANQSTDPTESV